MASSGVPCLLRLVFAALALLVHAQISHAERNTAALEALQMSVQEGLPGFEAYQADDEAALAAAIVKRPMELREEHEMRLAVFERNGTSYRLIAVSKTWEHYLLHRQGWSIRMKDQSILLTFGGSTSCCSGIEQVLRFRRMGDSVRLVGEETRTYGYEGVDDRNYYEAGLSINYLSGDVIHSKRMGPRKDNEQELGFGNKPRRKEVRMRFPVAEALDLANFGPDAYLAYQRGVPALCGYINQKMKYEPCKVERTAR